jgi:hypothetical protein
MYTHKGDTSAISRVCNNVLPGTARVFHPLPSNLPTCHPAFHPSLHESLHEILHKPLTTPHTPRPTLLHKLLTTLHTPRPTHTQYQDDDEYDGLPEDMEDELDEGEPDPRHRLGKILLALGKVHYRHAEPLPWWFVQRQVRKLKECL